MELLWTDQCFLLVILLSLISILVSLRKKHSRQVLQYLIKKPLPLSATIVLSFFFLIALLDCTHLPATHLAANTAKLNQNDSILDRLLAPLSNSHEKTYSAPFALTLYNVETILENGRVFSDYPRLSYPPASIKTKAEKQQLIMQIIYRATLVSLCGVILLWWLAIAIKWLSCGTLKILPTKRGLSALVTFFLCLLLVFASYWLSRKFHIFGTGKIGEDIFYYTVKSIRTGLIIGILTTLFMLPLALLLGVIAGYFGGFVDDIIQYIYTTLSSIPGVLLITASVLSMQTYIANHPQQFTTLAKSADMRLLALCLILGITSWTSLCRLLRAETLKLKEIDYIMAAKALGSSALTIIRKHLLPNVMHIVIITLALDFSFLVLAEAVLSYVGIGVSPMTISWGNMINGARLELARDPIVWWPIMAAFLFMFTLVLASNLFADTLRDAFDPHELLSD